MVTTNLDVIAAALRLLNVIAEGDVPSAEQAETGLQVLNEFLEDWSERGIDVGQWPQNDVQDPFPGNSQTLQTVKAWLAVSLAPYYERDARPAVIAMATNGYDKLLRDSIRDSLEPVELDLPVGSSSEINA